MQQDNINTIEREAIMVVTKEIDRKLYWKDIKNCIYAKKETYILFMKMEQKKAYSNASRKQSV